MQLPYTDALKGTLPGGCRNCPHLGSSLGRLLLVSGHNACILLVFKDCVSWSKFTDSSAAFISPCLPRCSPYLLGSGLGQTSAVCIQSLLQASTHMADGFAVTPCSNVARRSTAIVYASRAFRACFPARVAAILHLRSTVNAV